MDAGGELVCIGCAGCADPVYMVEAPDSLERVGCYPVLMDPIRFTRELVDVESITGNEAQVGDFLATRLTLLGFAVQKGTVERHRFNVLAVPPGQTNPKVVFSTHMDTVP